MKAFFLGIFIFSCLIVALIIGIIFFSANPPMGYEHNLAEIVYPPNINKKDYKLKNRSLYYIGGICRDFTEQRITAKTIAMISGEPVIAINTGSWEERNSAFRRFLKLIGINPPKNKNNCDDNIIGGLETLKCFVSLNYLQIGNHNTISAKTLRNFLIKDAISKRDSVVIAHSGGNYVLNAFLENYKYLNLSQKIKFYSIGSPIILKSSKNVEVHSIRNTGDYILCYQGYKVLHGNKIIDLSEPTKVNIFEALQCGETFKASQKSKEDPYGIAKHNIEYYLKEKHNEIFSF